MKSFIKYSKKIGSNFLLTQGPGGNTSIKIKNDIYVKKSGYYLQDAVTKSIFEKVNLKDANIFYKQQKKKDEKFKETLSIETPMHVMLPKKYVFHYHSISSIIMSLLNEKKSLNSFLIKNRILPIEYIRPGIKLAKNIIEKNTEYKFESFFLYNHGFVISGNNIAQLYSSILQTEKLFTKYVDPMKLKEISKNISNLRIENLKIRNPFPNLNYQLFNKMYLFPDHSVFLTQDFVEGTFSGKKNEINFNKDYLFLNKRFTSTEFIYLQVLLTIYGYIGNQRVENFISLQNSINLKSSIDEQMRLKINS